MCTLVLFHRLRDDLPLVAAANRDEFLARPAEGPRVLPGTEGLVGPRDLHAGGTWLAVSPAGVFAGLTNRPPRRDAAHVPLPDPSGTSTEVRDPHLRSRGEIVPLLLDRAESAEEAAERAARLPAGTWNPFYLLVADGRDAFAVSYRAEGPTVVPLAPGLHVLENRPIDDATSPKVGRVRELLAGAEALPADRLSTALFTALADHALPLEPDGTRPRPLEALCVHTPVYGTRSSTAVGLGPSGRWLRHAEGPPCTAPVRDHGGLLSPP